MKLVTTIFIYALFSIANLTHNSAVAGVTNSEQSRVLDISVQSIAGRIAAAITFSTALKNDVNLDQWLTIETIAGERVTGSWILDEKGKTLYFTNIEPEQSYIVHVKQGLPLVNWQLLAKGQSTKINVAAITPMLGFAGSGNLLADSLTDGLPVISVNAGEVDVDFYRIPQALLVSFLTNNTRRGQQEFWQIESFIDRLELVYTARFDLKLKRNQTATSYLPVKDIAPLQQQGVYLAIMRKAGEYKYSYPSTWFAISDLGIHVRLYADNAEVQVNSLATAQAQADVTLQLLNTQGKVIAQQQTTVDGNASFTQAEIEKSDLLIARQQGHTSIVRLFGPQLDLSELPVTGITNTAQQLFIYSERDLYRPGESLNISALLRDSDGKMLPPQVLTFQLKQPNGRVASEQRIRASALGYYASDWLLPKDAATGQWSVTAQIAGQEESQYNLQVEDFLPQRMALSLKAEPFIDNQQRFKVAVNGSYLYGAPAVDNVLQSELVTRLAQHPFKAFEEYYFANPQLSNVSSRISLDDKKLDANGNLSIDAQNHWHKANTPVHLKLYTSLLDSGGRPVNQSISSVALPATELVGIRPLFAEDTAPYDGSANFAIVLSDGDKKLAAQGLRVKLIREKRNYHWLYTESEGWTADYTERHFTVSTRNIDIKADGVANISLPVEWGHYRLEVLNPVTNIVTGYKFRAGWSADETVMAGRPDRIGLALNQQSYKNGDTVEVEIKAPAAGRGYLLVESDKQLHRQIIDIPAAGGTATFKIDKLWDTHNLYVSVLLIQPGAEREEKLPRRMMGVIPLRLDRESRKLQVQINTPEKILPNTQLRVPLTVVGSNGDQVPGSVQVTVAAVDVGILNISRFTSPDPFSGFFQQRAYGVSARDSYSDLINAEDGVLAQLKFGGDSDAVQNGEADPDVQIVSLFSGVVEVGVDGKAFVVMDIPNFNGRLRLMAVAFSEQSFGSAEKELTVAAPIVAQLTKPRLLRAGDKSQLALDLNNLTALDQTLAVQLSLGDGLSFSSADNGDKQHQQLSVKLNKSSKKILYFPIVASANYRSVEIDLSVANIALEGSDQIPTQERHWQLSIAPSWPKTDQLMQALLSTNESFVLTGKEMDNYLTSSLSGQLNVSNQPPLDIASHFNALKAYPYGCLEQTTSGVFPQLYVNDMLLADLGIKGSDLKARTKAIDLAIQRLQTMQRGSGGFGLWSQQSPEEHWLSVYVVDFLLRAQDLGYQVPQANLQKALQRIKIYLRSPNKISSYYEDVNQTTKFAIRAYAGQVLARYKQAPLSILRRMFENRSGKETPMSLLQLGLALQSAGDKTRANKAIEEAVVRLVNIDKTNEHAIYYASAVRDLALSSFWLLETNASSEQWHPLLLELTARLKNKNWLSTQERNALFLLGKTLKTATANQLQLALEIDAKKETKTISYLQLQLSSDALKQAIKVTNLAKENAYLNLRSSGYEKTAPAAIDNALQIERRYYDLDGKEFSAKQLTSGDKLIVELSVRADKRMRHALLVDLLPAGLEIENQNLADSYDQDSLQINGEKISEIMYELNVAYQEYRDDRFVMAIDLPRKRLVRVYYLVRAVSPGTYTVPATFGEDMYRPELRHQGSSAGKLTVLPR
ncbi:MAG: alpha-2-macroglobulin [Oceanospirillaceae bacterium]